MPTTCSPDIPVNGTNAGSEQASGDDLPDTLQTEILVDVIIPVHNASDTIAQTVRSAMTQVIPENLRSIFRRKMYQISLYVCCYDDGSTDDSWKLLCGLEQQFATNGDKELSGHAHRIQSKLLIAKSPAGLPGRGAGYARNHAVEMRRQQYRQQLAKGNNKSEDFLCLLDSDDTMQESRVAEQVYGMMSLSPDERRRMLMGCRIERDPPDATWHYTQWANGLTEAKLYLERFREITVLQPTWMMQRSRFEELGGYIEAPPPLDSDEQDEAIIQELSQPTSDPRSPPESNSTFRLVHPTVDTPLSLRLAEDLRFFHAHLHKNGLLRVHEPNDPKIALVTYRHRVNQSQSYSTSRKLLMHLRVYAFERCVLNFSKNHVLNDNSEESPWIPSNQYKGAFVVWGAGRDGKEFVKALSAENRRRVYCFVDVDRKKIDQGYYINRDEALKIPIVHFSLLASTAELRQQLLDEFKRVEEGEDVGTQNNLPCYGRIDKSKPKIETGPSLEASDNRPKQKRQKLNRRAVVTKDVVPALSSVMQTIDLSVLPKLPVVVCVAMYRTNGALERNVKAIGRSEGVNLWHFS